MVKKKNKLTRSAMYISKHESFFTCPTCASPVKIQDLRSLICTNGHTFDIAKQGYLNLLSHHNKTNYDKTLFEARRKVIAESRFFDPLNTALTKIINDQTTHKRELNIVDMGSGEGTHLINIVQTLQSDFEKTVTGIGIDISKEGILEAAKHYEETIWVVADLARTPLTDQMCDVMINILSPSNYEEFNRLLKEDGMVIKIVPRESYLKELRQYFYNKSEKEDYSNQTVVDHFKKHFNIIDQTTVYYTKPLSQAAIMALIKMTPLTWNVDAKDINAFLEKGISEITIDLEILVGKKK